jgi:hypothetical protein
MFDELIVPLGVTADNRLVYYDRVLKDIRFLSANDHTKRNLLFIAPEYEWKKAIRRLDKETQKRLLRRGRIGQVDLHWDNLAAELMKLSRSKGRYDPTKIRGRGLWPRSDGKRVYNTGQQLFLISDQEVKEIELFDNELNGTDRHHYVARPDVLAPPSIDEATADECRRVFAVFDRFAWSNGPHEACLLKGWIACAPVANLLPFRPHIGITAESKAGKSAVLRAVKATLGPGNFIDFSMDQSTEPGVRQMLGPDALPSIFDEFETYRAGTRDVIRLLRITSYPDGGKIVKGSASGVPMSFEPRTTALGVGIVIRFEHSADESRWALIEVGKLTHAPAEKKTLKAMIEQIDPAFGSRLMRRMVVREDMFMQNHERFHKAIFDRGGDDRAADLFGTIYAGLWTACFDEPVTEAEAAEALAWFDSRQDDNQDHQDCLNHLLAYRLKPYGDITVGQALAKVTDTKTSRSCKKDILDALEAFGVRYDEGRREVIVANRTPEILSWFKGTVWANGQHARVLKRMGGHDGGNKTVRFGTTPSKATWLPLDKVLPDIFDGSDEQL